MDDVERSAEFKLWLAGGIGPGAEVQVVLTPDAANFVGPLTFSTLSNRPVLVDYFDQKTGEWNNHVHLN